MTTDAQPASGTSPGFGFVILVTVHFNDLDLFGMLHNSRYSMLVEQAWATYWRRREIGFTKDWTLAEDGFHVVKELRVSYELPIDRPGDYGVHIWLERIGRTSLTHGFRIYSGDVARSHAHGSRTLVHIDPATLRPAEWSREARSLSEKLLRPDH